MSAVEQWLMVRCSVVTESHPAALVLVYVGVLVLAVYSEPCHTKLLQAVTVSMAELL